MPGVANSNRKVPIFVGLVPTSARRPLLAPLLVPLLVIVISPHKVPMLAWDVPTRHHL